MEPMGGDLAACSQLAHAPTPSTIDGCGPSTPEAVAKEIHEISGALNVGDGGSRSMPHKDVDLPKTLPTPLDADAEPPPRDECSRQTFLAPGSTADEQRHSVQPKGKKPRYHADEGRRKADVQKRRNANSIAQLVSVGTQQSAWLEDIPLAPVYTPTSEEWKDPLAYIRSIQEEAAKFGMCVIKAPVAPAAPAGIVLKDFRFTTRQQRVKDCAYGPNWDCEERFYEKEKKYTLAEFQQVADDFARRKLGLPAGLPPRTVEALYWAERASSTGPSTYVEYGNDLDGSAFHPDDPLGATDWNLNTLPSLETSALRWIKNDVPGVSSPMLYIGMLYATFAWHVEDHFLYSINYQHAGAPKIWYGVPASAADAFEAAVGQTVYAAPCASMENEGVGALERRCRVAAELMAKTTSLSPGVLSPLGVPVFRAVQDVGCFVATFPRAYHCGFSCGFNIGEAVNFATPEWWPFGDDARFLYRRLGRAHIVPHEQALCDEALGVHSRFFASAGEKGKKRRCGEDEVEEKQHNNLEIANDENKVAESVDVSQNLKRGDTIIMRAFSRSFQRLYARRVELQRRGIPAVLACSPGCEEEHCSLHCSGCSHLCYACSVVVNATDPITSWQHFCLECAAEKTTSRDIVSILFVKPCWSLLHQTAVVFDSALAEFHDGDGNTFFDEYSRNGNWREMDSSLPLSINIQEFLPEADVAMPDWVARSWETRGEQRRAHHERNKRTWDGLNVPPNAVHSDNNAAASPVESDMSGAKGLAYAAVMDAVALKHISNDIANALQESSGSGPMLRRWILPGENNSNSTVVVPATHVFRAIAAVEGGKPFAVLQKYRQCVRTIARCSDARAAHIAALGPFFLYCAKWKAKGIGSALLLRLEQCAVIAQFALRDAAKEAVWNLAAKVWGDVEAKAMWDGVRKPGFTPYPVSELLQHKDLQTALREALAMEQKVESYGGVLGSLPSVLHVASALEEMTEADGGQTAEKESVRDRHVNTPMAIQVTENALTPAGLAASVELSVLKPTEVGPGSKEAEPTPMELHARELIEANADMEIPLPGRIQMNPLVMPLEPPQLMQRIPSIRNRHASLNLPTQSPIDEIFLHEVLVPFEEFLSSDGTEDPLFALKANPSNDDAHNNMQHRKRRSSLG